MYKSFFCKKCGQKNYICFDVPADYIKFHRYFECKYCKYNNKIEFIKGQDYDSIDENFRGIILLKKFREIINLYSDLKKDEQDWLSIAINMFINKDSEFKIFIEGSLLDKPIKEEIMDMFKKEKE